MCGIVVEHHAYMYPETVRQNERVDHPNINFQLLSIVTNIAHSPKVGCQQYACSTTISFSSLL